MKVFLVSEVDTDFQHDLAIFDSIEKAIIFKNNYTGNYTLSIQEFEVI